MYGTFWSGEYYAVIDSLSQVIVLYLDYLFIFLFFDH